jgi:hypothetical protein
VCTQTYGEAVDATTLIPLTLEAFIARIGVQAGQGRRQPAVSPHGCAEGGILDKFSLSYPGYD